MIVTRMIAIQMRVEDRVVDLSHLMMHRVKVMIALAAIAIRVFKLFKHLD
jgi:hypothetical protein